MLKPYIENVQTITAVGSRGFNEDDLVNCPDYNLFAVLDGASPLDRSVNPNGETVTGGQIASRTAKEVLSSNPDKPLRTLLVMANMAVRAKQIFTDDPAQLIGTTISAVRLHDEYLEWATVGDSPLIVVDKDGKAHPVGGLENWDTESLLLWKELKKEDPAGNTRNDPRMKRQLAEVRRQANIEYGYCNGDPAMENRIRIGVYPVEKIGAFLLMTDGCMLPQQDPSAPVDWQIYADLHARRGARSILHTVRKIEKSDPDRKIYPGFKEHDDGTIVCATFR